MKKGETGTEEGEKEGKDIHFLANNFANDLQCKTTGKVVGLGWVGLSWVGLPGTQNTNLAHFTLKSGEK